MLQPDTIPFANPFHQVFPGGIRPDALCMVRQDQARVDLTHHGKHLLIEIIIKRSHVNGLSAVHRAGTISGQDHHLVPDRLQQTPDAGSMPAACRDKQDSFLIQFTDHFDIFRIQVKCALRQYGVIQIGCN